MNNDQLNTLKEFKAKYGNDWKQILSDLWMSGKDTNEQNGHLLRQIRNNYLPLVMSKKFSI